MAKFKAKRRRIPRLGGGTYGLGTYGMGTYGGATWPSLYKADARSLQFKAVERPLRYKAVLR